MRMLRSRDPVPQDARILTDQEIEASILRATERMRSYIAIGEFQLAGVCEHARDRMLDALSARLSPARAPRQQQRHQPR